MTVYTRRLGSGKASTHSSDSLHCHLPQSVTFTRLSASRDTHSSGSLRSLGILPTLKGLLGCASVPALWPPLLPKLTTQHLLLAEGPRPSMTRTRLVAPAWRHCGRRDAPPRGPAQGRAALRLV
jgi:hypothetical protein